MSDTNNPLFPSSDQKPEPGKREDNPAVELIRSKINALYDDKSQEPQTEPDAKEELLEAEAAGPHRSKHQKFMLELSSSGKSLAEIQEAWHKYYQELPDKEKHEVWQEFYAEHSKIDRQIKQSQVRPPQQSAFMKTEPAEESVGAEDKAGQDLRSVSDMKHQIISNVKRRAKPRNPHLQSLLFGLGMGFVTVAIMLFGFFNERIIAPFITPSRTVSSTPIVTDLSSTAVSKEPKIIIPKINVEIPVVYDEPSIEEDAVQKALERGVLHYGNTPNPGEKGNAVIFGHSSNNILNSGKYKFAFVLLSRLENGDTFMLEKDGKRYVYKVFDKRIVAPSDLSVLGDYTGKTATASLITCDPPGTSRNRLVVTGEQISPDPNQNIASTVKKETASEKPKILPSNSPSLWSRIIDWF